MIETLAECNATHGVQEEVDAEVGVIEMHEELLETPHEGGRGLPIDGMFDENVQSDEIAETENRRFREK